MHLLRLLVLCCYATAVMCTTPAWGASFALSENGAKAQSMGGAFVGQADDPSAVWYNPAGLVRQGGRSISLGANFFLPDISVPLVIHPGRGR